MERIYSLEKVDGFMCCVALSGFDFGAAFRMFGLKQVLVCCWIFADIKGL